MTKGGTTSASLPAAGAKRHPATSLLWRRRLREMLACASYTEGAKGVSPRSHRGRSSVRRVHTESFLLAALSFEPRFRLALASFLRAFTTKWSGSSAWEAELSFAPGLALLALSIALALALATGMVLRAIS